MESSAFTQDETSTADPFGDDGQGDFTQDDPLAEAEAAEELRAEQEAAATAEPVEGIPVVDADGEQVVVGGEDGLGLDAASQGVASVAEPEVETTTPIEQREAAVAAARPSVGSDGLPIPTTPAKPDPTPAAASTPTASAPAESGSSDTPTPAGVTAEPSDAAEPEATKTHRKYVLLAADGEGKFTQVSWYEDKKGEMVAKGTASAKKQNVCLASGQDQALGIGWRALGSPEGGCSLVAVAAGYFQIRHVGPDREPPKNPRLKIR